MITREEVAVKIGRQVYNWIILHLPEKGRSTDMVKWAMEVIYRKSSFLGRKEGE